MIHDLKLVDQITALPTEKFEGHVFRATSLSADPTAFSTSVGRWTHPFGQDGGYGVLYTCLDRDGAVAEVAGYLLELEPIPTRPLKVHELAVSTSKTLKLAKANLSDLGVDLARYKEKNYERTQQIGAAINFLGLDGLIAPSARWDCSNVMIFSDNHSLNERLDVLKSEQVDAEKWQRIFEGPS